MKLTNYMRDAFVRAVMDDVPEVDYKQQIRDTALKAAVEAMPAKLRAVWDDSALQDCVAMEHTCRLGRKDLAQALDLARHHGVAMPAAEAARSEMGTIHSFQTASIV